MFYLLSLCFGCLVVFCFLLFGFVLLGLWFVYGLLSVSCACVVACVLFWLFGCFAGGLGLEVGCLVVRLGLCSCWVWLFLFLLSAGLCGFGLFCAVVYFVFARLFLDVCLLVLFRFVFSFGGLYFVGGLAVFCCLCGFYGLRCALFVCVVFGFFNLFVGRCWGFVGFRVSCAFFGDNLGW